MGKMIDAVAERVALDLFVNRERAAIFVIIKGHLWGVVASFAVDKITEFGILNNHLGPEWVAWEAEKIIAAIGGDLNNDIGPSGKDVLGFEDFFISKSFFNNLIQRIFGSKKRIHAHIITCYTIDMENVKILAVVGMSGSGKSVVVDHLTEKGYPKVYFGGMIYKEMEKRGIERTEDGESEKKFREMIRETEGKDWVVRQVIAEVKDLIAAGQKRIVLDGVYSWTEYKTLKHEFPGVLTFLAVVVDKKLRYKRVAVRPGRSFDTAAIQERDRSEIENLEKGGPIAAADYYALNNGSAEELTARVDEVLKEIEF